MNRECYDEGRVKCDVCGLEHVLEAHQVDALEERNAIAWYCSDECAERADVPEHLIQPVPE